jgi:hypothetical protein
VGDTGDVETVRTLPARAHPVAGTPAAADRAGVPSDLVRLRAEAEVAAAIAVVAGHPEFRIEVCGLRGGFALIRRLDERAAARNVQLVWRARGGGVLDVLARPA